MQGKVDVDIAIIQVLAEALLVMLRQPVMKQLHAQYPLLKEKIASLPQEEQHDKWVTFLAAQQSAFKSARQWLSSSEQVLITLTRYQRHQQLEQVTQRMHKYEIDKQFIPILAPTILTMILEEMKERIAIEQSITTLSLK